MSKIQVDAIEQQTSCGSTLTVGGGASKTVVVDATTVTLGRSGGTVALASGASQTGFGRTGTVDWQTTPKTATFTAVSGEGYFANTTGSAFNMNLPAGVAGAIVSVADYAATFQTNNLTVVPNGTDKIGALNQNAILNVEGQSVTFVFVDSTQGWINTMDSTSNVRGKPPFIVATGGTISNCGNFKTHIFTGPGTFAISNISGCATSNKIDYVVVAGGGSGGSSAPGGGGSGTGGGGAGGFRLANSLGLPAPTMSPLANPTGLTGTVASFPILVGAGAAPATTGSNTGNNGAVSTFSSITSAGGGGGGSESPKGPGNPGGSGGGSGYNIAGGIGNTPPVSPPQGNSGGSLSSTNAQYSATGGGGAGAVGQTNPANNIGGAGGIGSFTADTFIGSPAPGFGTPGPVSSTRYFAGGGGGGGGIDSGPSSTGGVGSSGGGTGGNGGSGAPGSQGSAGTINTGSGGGGSSGTPSPANGGGSGIVMIRYRFQ